MYFLHNNKMNKFRTGINRIPAQQLSLQVRLNQGAISLAGSFCCSRPFCAFFQDRGRERNP